ncbi:MAG: cytochrome-c oxidase, cbb3-type subunit III [Hyphomicrobium sp.]|nr:cytochrome-c oxidase, cbb3-type subunit III [Hyphomicrobium sp.]
MASDKHFDEVTGTETTGHVWDGDLRELNKPLPKWWLYVLYACIVWSIGYWAVYPAWPTMSDYTKGYWNYSQRAAVTQEVADAKAAQDKYRVALSQTPLADVGKNPELLQFALAGGQATFGENCAACHGRGAQGGVGYPNLNDDDWIWGGQLDNIQQTISYGIRSGHAKTRDSAMPRFGLDGALDAAKIGDVANYVRSLSGLEADKTAAGRGAAVFAENCAVCHGADGKGNQELGAPNLTDGIWLYGNGQENVVTSISTGRGGIMPAWDARLDPVSVKMLAVYVHSLGGGK